MRDGSQTDLIFPSTGDESFSDMAMLAVLKRMNYSHVTVHGFRATFATWAEECTDYPDGVREAALAHKYKNETMAAYQRGAMATILSISDPRWLFDHPYNHGSGRFETRLLIDSN